MNNNYWKKEIAKFLTAQTVSLFGSSLVQYAIVWYITLSTSSGKMLTIATLCGFLPQIVISFFAGVWIDRYNRKKLIIFSDGIIALSTGILAVLFLFGQGKVWLLFTVLAIRSTGTGLQTPAVNAVIPQIVPKEGLMRINGINSTISSLTMFLSPAVSGMILAMYSLETVLFFDVFTAIIGIGITLTVKINPYNPKLSWTGSAFIELGKGIGYLREHHYLKYLILFQLVILFLISPSAFLTPLMVSRTFGPEVWRLTASEMSYSLGMIVGGILITAWGGFKNHLNTTLLAGCVYGCIMIGLGVAPLFFVYLMLNMMIGITAPCYNTPITVLIQEKVDPSMHGRIFSMMQISTSCALPLGMVVFGPLADIVNVQSLLMISGSVVLAVVIFVRCFKLFDRE